MRVSHAVAVIVAEARYSNDTRYTVCDPGDDDVNAFNAGILQSIRSIEDIYLARVTVLRFA